VNKINLSFLKLTEDNPKIQQELDNRYNKFILNALKCKFTNVSGCLLCGAECGHFTTDCRKLIEVSNKGLLGDHFCIVPEQYDGEELNPGDLIIIIYEDVTELVTVKLTGELVQFKRLAHSVCGDDLPVVCRKVNQDDMIRLSKNKIDEERAKSIFKEKMLKFNLGMKLVDIHYQFDRNKLFFFYTADGRVDFRELAKDLASEFKTRIELRQIGVRDEAKRIGGVATCGREYCCSLFLNNFKKISTQLASEQNLSSSLAKLSGPCGKLKCCLSYESDISLSDN